MDDFSPKYFRVMAILLLISASVIPYINTLSNNFVFDDKVCIIQNKEIREPSNLFIFMQRPRGVKYITHLVEYQIWGLEPFAYHAVNIVLHMFCTISLYVLLVMIISGRLIPLIAGLLFAAHPIHTEAVAFISGRTDLLAALFFLWAFIFYLMKNNSLLFYLLSLLSFILALFSKEGAVVSLPVMIIIHDIFFTKPGKGRLSGNILYYVPYGLILIAFILYLRFILVIHPASPEPEISGLFLHKSFPVFFYTGANAFLVYIRLLFLPVNLNAEHVLALSFSLFDLRVIVSLASLILFLVFTFMAYRLSKTVAFGMTWFFITLLPLLNLLFPVTPYFVAERYLYLPSVGFCLIAALTCKRFSNIDVPQYTLYLSKAVAFIILTGILYLYSGMAINRNFDWVSDYALWSKTVKQSPGSSRAHNNLGVAYAEKGMIPEALTEFKTALKYDPHYQIAYSNLGESYRKKGMWDLAISSYEKALMINPRNTSVMNNLGNVYSTVGKFDLAIDIYNKALRINPGHAQLHINLDLANRKKALLDQTSPESKSPEQ